MFPYLITFFLSILCFEIGTRRLDEENEVFPMSYLWIGLSMLFPILLATLRSENIGDDVIVYAIPTFDIVKDSDNLFDAFDRSEVEFLYISMANVAKYISVEMWSLLFLTEFCIVVPFWVALIKLSGKLDSTFALFIFYAVFYNHTLNMMRQSIALALIFLAVAYMLENKKGWMVFWLCIAFGFHKSAVLGFALPFLFYFSQKYPLYENLYTYLWIYLGLVLIASNFASFIVLMIDNGVLDLKYLIYTEVGVFESKVTKSLLFIVLVELILLYVAVDNYGDLYLELNFFFLCALITVLFCLTGYIVVYLARISWYFHIINFLSISYVLCNPNIFGKFIPLRWGFVLLLCFYWWFAFVLGGESSTIPYEMQNQLE